MSQEHKINNHINNLYRVLPLSERVPRSVTFRPARNAQALIVTALSSYISILTLSRNKSFLTIHSTPTNTEDPSLLYVQLVYGVV